MRQGSCPSRVQRNPQDEWHWQDRDTVRQSLAAKSEVYFSLPLYTLNNIFWEEVHIAYTQVISKHYSNLTFNRNRMPPTYFSFTIIFLII